jgi:hypothetical protein
MTVSKVLKDKSIIEDLQNVSIVELFQKVVLQNVKIEIEEVFIE